MENTPGRVGAICWEFRIASLVPRSGIVHIDSVELTVNIAALNRLNRFRVNRVKNRTIESCKPLITVFDYNWLAANCCIYPAPIDHAPVLYFDFIGELTQATGLLDRGGAGCPAALLSTIVVCRRMKKSAPEFTPPLGSALCINRVLSNVL